MQIKYQNLQIDDYEYSLPSERIAKYPLLKRDDSNLLVYEKGNLSKNQFYNIHNYLPSGATLVFNNTKVIQARLLFRKETGALIEIFCLEPVDPSDYVLAFQEKEKITWKCIVGNLKKWKDQELSLRLIINKHEIVLKARKIKSEENAQFIEFTWNNNSISFSEILETAGLTPIPPYLNRESEEIDKERYQTIYSKLKGSVAAPTAGLHFTDEVFKKILIKGLDFEEITLHVGAGTFKPVKSSLIVDHEMHTEHFVVRKSSIQKLIKSKKIVAVGTTSVRTIESLYWLGIRAINLKDGFELDTHISQWEAYANIQTNTKNSTLQALLDFMETNQLNEIYASTQIMIVPGYKFRLVDILITNFHQPRSTLLLLIAAFIGNNWKKVYDFALKNEFRFLSYGDSSVLIP
ncbi:MAG: S-adenosylmethionine tRNA ribosyltransferase [Bacteroidetes bacterium GWF2_33_16]|nr:MAG: S-adenosylmethionine tRNA ribosyltransferase [Bacteroidetes bacterium GWE2_32_14]OFY07128.1 MAG: S-adenosylmethionine tRNA ribosyltransferase [Bacteroidetes bacterium GWF2_33_16]